ncbi:glyoxylate/hydroxypyruvate reductase A [Paucibacter sp. O1-1]|nr:glyoxylate/hydroxypyruvate reductase A [Paucibacter sp. O1-1]MDA3830257.1 glyoxylate/hydroxypyruvate reductase A [Paucibacter sp. O1-1]
MAILVLSAPLPSAPFVAALRAAAPEVQVWTGADAPPPEAVEAILAWRLKPGQLGAYPNLRLLCSTGAGVEKLLAVPDLPPGLPVSRVVDPLQARTMAQYVIACALHFSRDLPLYAAQQARAEWRRHPVRSPERCRVGILGQGAVAQAVAAAFVPLGYPVTLWGRQAKQFAGLQSLAGASALPQLLARSDLLVCTLPLTPATQGLLNRERLAQLPRGAVLINVGRGGHLVEADLLTLLDEGHLAGAALDVFEREPLPAESRLWCHPRVLATPHIAGEAREAVVAEQCLAALRAVRAGRRPEWAVDRAAGY